jgi:TetR/AcrR family acrAB operon transcriptional repressor
MARSSPEVAARTRESVIDAALHVFAERGFAATQLEEIAQRAEVTRGAVYHHFDGKTDLYLAVLRERWQRATAPILAHLDAGDVRAFVRAFIDAVNDDDSVRCLMKMSLSHDLELPAFAAHAQEKLDVWASWTKRVAAVTKRSRSRARALVIALIGYATFASVRPTRDGESERAALAEAFTSLA